MSAFDDNNAPKECPVCLDDIHPVSECRLRCNHSICSQCITQLRKGACPVCRKSIFPEDELPPPGESNGGRVGGGGHTPPGHLGSSHIDTRPSDYRARQHTLHVPATRTALLRHHAPPAPASRTLSGDDGMIRVQGGAGQLHFSLFCA